MKSYVDRSIAGQAEFIQTIVVKRSCDLLDEISPGTVARRGGNDQRELG
ncbi:hypothetical protein [Bradyrhizobium cajani]|nr:hypothetical protein [Bradyrhizobium cajani]MCP3373908.1 hypothetical protein [Bradyrhizobium cajani]